MTEYKTGCAVVRIHGTPDQDKLKAATTFFMKKVTKCRKNSKSKILS